MRNQLTSVITGAAGGLGHALATLLAERGDSLVLVDIDRDGVEAVAGRLDAAVALCVDVADPAAMDQLARATDRCDLLCLNAGVLSEDVGPPWESSPDEWERVLGVNLGGVVNGLRSFVPRLLEQPTPSHVLITASLAGLATWPGGGPYGASKHAVVAVAEQAALALQASPVAVSVLCPGLVQTAMSPEGEDPAVVAAGALAALDTGRFAIVPEAWAPAVRERSVLLTSGQAPRIPTVDTD